MFQLFVIGSYVVASWIIAVMGRDRRFGFWGYFFASLLLTPFIGLLLYLATDGPMRPRHDAGTPPSQV
jgi:hypothetical protein